MKVLIIGASGLLARPVIEQMDTAGFQLRLFSRTVNQSLFKKEYEIIQGDVFNPVDLDKAISGCHAVHISLANLNEAMAVKTIVDIALKKGIKLISYVSGCTVARENRWFTMIDNKFRAEQIIINSGIPYMIFRPTWFFESLDLMIRNGKAMMLGKQPHPSHWVAAGDFAKMVSSAYIKPAAENRIFFVWGPEQHLMRDLLEKYCRIRYPEINKISSLPIGVLKIMAVISGNKGLKNAAALFAYFEKTGEMGDPEETDRLLGKPETTFEKWIQKRK